MVPAAALLAAGAGGPGGSKWKGSKSYGGDSEFGRGESLLSGRMGQCSEDGSEFGAGCKKSRGG